MVLANMKLATANSNSNFQLNAIEEFSRNSLCELGPHIFFEYCENVLQEEKECWERTEIIYLTRNKTQ